VSTAKWPVSVAVGDFNGDGKLDMVTANHNSGTVSVLLGNGDGSFASATDYAIPNSPLFVAVGDFNGDGKLDLAVVADTPPRKWTFDSYGKRWQDFCTSRELLGRQLLRLYYRVLAPHCTCRRFQ
jgi:hypothetical protein